MRRFNEGIMDKEPFLAYWKNVFCVDEDDLVLEIIRAAGLEIEQHNDYIKLATYFRPIKDQVICFVDTETTGNNHQNGQIIDIAAVKSLNGKIIDTFDSLIFASEVPDLITELTGLTTTDLKDAPTLSQVLGNFRLFLGDSLFCAHNAFFDYAFISDSLTSCGYAPLLNRSMCSIYLAKQAFQAEKYGLKALSEQFSWENLAHHRALNDALLSKVVFDYSLQCLPTSELLTTENLIYLCMPEKTKKKQKKLSL